MKFRTLFWRETSHAEALEFTAPRAAQLLIHNYHQHVCPRRTTLILARICVVPPSLTALNHYPPRAVCVSSFFYASFFLSFIHTTIHFLLFFLPLFTHLLYQYFLLSSFLSFWNNLIISSLLNLYLFSIPSFLFSFSLWILFLAPFLIHSRSIFFQLSFLPFFNDINYSGLSLFFSFFFLLAYFMSLYRFSPFQFTSLFSIFYYVLFHLPSYYIILLYFISSFLLRLG